MTSVNIGMHEARTRNPLPVMQSVLRNRLSQFLLIALFALAIRSPLLGAWNHDVDDQFYALVGSRLREGALLYVDVWDRKGPALYLFYALFGGRHGEPLGYQLAATAMAALGGYGVSRIARTIAEPLPALLAGLAYCALLIQFGGENGQAPVLYNPLVIAGAWTVTTRLQRLLQGQIDLALVAGMAASGMAIAFKQSAAIESAFFGLTAAALLVRRQGSRPRLAGQVALLALAGALPMLATFGWFLFSGHFEAMWQALILSNLDRGYDGGGTRLWLLLVLAGRLALPLAFAVAGTRLALRSPDMAIRQRARFLASWAAVSVLAVGLFPAVYPHYALTVLAPLCILSAPFFARAGIGRPAFLMLAATALLLGINALTSNNGAAREESARFEAYIREHTPGRRLFVWGAPSLLYARIGSHPPSVLLFAPHLYEASEAAATGHRPLDELERILAWQPETVVYQNPLPMLASNPATLARIRTYLGQCRTARRFILADHLGPQVQWVYTGCSHR